MCDTDYTGGELRAMAQELVAKVLAEDGFVAPEVAGHPELFCREVSEELASAPKEIQESVLNVQSGAQRNKEAMVWAKARAEERKARAEEKERYQAAMVAVQGRSTVPMPPEAQAILQSFMYQQNADGEWVVHEQ